MRHLAALCFGFGDATSAALKQQQLPLSLPGRRFLSSMLPVILLPDGRFSELHTQFPKGYLGQSPGQTRGQ